MMPCLNITCKCSMIKLLNLSENQQKSMWTSTKDQFVRKLSRLKSNDLVTHTDSTGYNVHRAFELLSFYLKKYDIYNVIYQGLCMLGLTAVKLRYPQTHVARILSIINNSMALRKSGTWKTYSWVVITIVFSIYSVTIIELSSEDHKHGLHFELPSTG